MRRSEVVVNLCPSSRSSSAVNLIRYIVPTPTPHLGIGVYTKMMNYLPRHVSARHYRVIRRDMRGHGQSADLGPNHAWSVEELLTDIKGFLDALNLDRVHYVGESIGGLLGIACAVRWPERFKSLTLCAGAIKIPPSVQRNFAVGYVDWYTALGALGAGG